MRDWLSIELVLGALLVTSFTCVGLVALWAATSPRHWFIRAAVVLAMLSPLLAVPAYEPLLIFALEAATIVAGVKLWQWLAKRDHLHGVVQFSLKSLLLSTTLIAVVTAIGTRITVQMPPQTVESWTTILLNGVAGGLAVLLAAWIVASPRKPIVWPVATLLCLGLAAALAWFDWLLLSFTLAIDAGWPPDATTAARALGNANPHPQLAWLLILPAVLLLVLLVISIYFAAVSPAAVSKARQVSRPRASSPRLARAAVALLLVAIAGFPLYVLWDLLHPLPPPTFPQLSPNGFDQITAAGREFDRSQILRISVRPQSTAQLAAEVAKYAPSFEKVRLGLSQDVRARQWPQGGERWPPYRWSDDPVPSATRAVARAMDMEAELAQRQNRHADAARISLDINRLGLATSLDGNLVDYLVGIALEGVSHQSLYPSIAQLTPDQCQATTKALIELDRAREPLVRVLQRDRVWNQLALGWHGHLRQILEDIAPRSEGISAVRRALRRTQAVKRMLIIELAIRAYQLEYGTLPDSLEDLTPGLPQELLIDPFDPSGRTFRYVSTGNSYLLYSVGVDGQDNQGRATGRTAGISNDDQDLRLDVFLAPEYVFTTNTTTTDGAEKETNGRSDAATDQTEKVEESDRK